MPNFAGVGGNIKIWYCIALQSIKAQNYLANSSFLGIKLLSGSSVMYKVRARVSRWWEHSPQLPPSWPGFQTLRRRHLWVEIVVGSLPCFKRFFPGVSCFSPLVKNQHFQINSNSIWNARTRFNEFIWTPKCPVGKQITIFTILNFYNSILYLFLIYYVNDEAGFLVS